MISTGARVVVGIDLSRELLYAFGLDGIILLQVVLALELFKLEAVTRIDFVERAIEVSGLGTAAAGKYGNSYHCCHDECN